MKACGRSALLASHAQSPPRLHSHVHELGAAQLLGVDCKPGSVALSKRYHALVLGERAYPTGTPQSDQDAAVETCSSGCLRWQRCHNFAACPAALRAVVATSALAIASPHPSLLMTASTSATSSAVCTAATAIEGRSAGRLGVMILPVRPWNRNFCLFQALRNFKLY